MEAKLLTFIILYQVHARNQDHPIITNISPTENCTQVGWIPLTLHGMMNGYILEYTNPTNLTEVATINVTGTSTCIDSDVDRIRVCAILENRQPSCSENTSAAQQFRDDEIGRYYYITLNTMFQYK